MATRSTLEPRRPSTSEDRVRLLTFTTVFGKTRWNWPTLIAPAGS